MICAKSSSFKSIRTGVPQGSILGPIMYTVFIDEISDVTKDDNCTDINHVNNNEELFSTRCLKCGEVPAYTDNATVIAASSSRPVNQMKIEDNLMKMENFLSDNQLSMNKSKMTIVESMVKQKCWWMTGSLPKIKTINNLGETKIITAGRSTMILGCNVPDNLSWKEHLISGEKPLLKELRKKVGAIKHSTAQHSNYPNFADKSWPQASYRAKCPI